MFTIDVIAASLCMAILGVDGRGAAGAENETPQAWSRVGRGIPSPAD